MARELAAPPLAESIRGKAVGYTGRLGLMSHEDFVDVVEGHGGRFCPRGDPAAAVLIVGEHDCVLAPDGTPVVPVSDHLRVLSERQFLADLGMGVDEEAGPKLYSSSSLCELLEISAERLRAWVRAGLIAPVKTEHAVGYYEFRQVSTAKTLCDAARAGVTLSRLRKSLEQLRRWMPDTERALEQLAVLERSGPLLVRLEDGELSEPTGQYHFDFTGEPEPLPLQIAHEPATAARWFGEGVEQEQHGFLAEAAESYRQALAAGGPTADACFNLANVLAALGHTAEAIERYRQAVEIAPRYADAWNNLGLAWCQAGKREDACSAFRKALAADGGHPRAHYNLADTLEELGRVHEARPHWQAYLRQDPFSPWGRHARGRLA